MYGVVQKVKCHQDNAFSADMTRTPHKSMSRCVNLTAAYSNFCIVGFMARTKPRYDVDRIDATMIMSFRVSRSNPQKEAACPRKRNGKTGIFCGPHLVGYPLCDWHVL
jgi:hypothetical protein